MDTIPSSREKRALDELNLILDQRQKFVKVHAAEYLIWNGHPEEALKEFLQEEKLYSNEPKYRVVIWRVLVQAESDPARKQVWLNKIYDAYKDMNGTDRTHATEALAKLKQPVSKLFPEATAKTLVSDDRNLQVYALWASSFGSESLMDVNREKFVGMVLTDTNLIVRKISAFVLRQSKGLNLQQWERITSLALSSKKSDDSYVTFLATALVTAPVDSDKKKLKMINDLILQGVKSYSAGERMELAQALAERGSKKHLPVLMSFINNENIQAIYEADSDEGADLRASAAYAILRIKSREN